MDASKRLLKGNAAGQNQDFQKGFPRSSEPVCILGFYQMMHCSKYKHPSRQIFDKLHLAVLQHFAFGVGVPFGFAPMILLQDFTSTKRRLRTKNSPYWYILAGWSNCYKLIEEAGWDKNPNKPIFYKNYVSVCKMTMIN